MAGFYSEQRERVLTQLNDDTYDINHIKKILHRSCHEMHRREGRLPQVYNKEIKDRIINDFGWTQESKLEYTSKLKKVLRIQDEHILNDSMGELSTQMNEEKIEVFDQESSALVKTHYFVKKISLK